MNCNRHVVNFLICFGLFTCAALAQNEVGRWTIGGRGGANVWISDYNQDKIGDGGEIMLRYGITTMFSAGIVAGYEELKTYQDPISQYPLLKDPYLKAHAIPVSMDAYFHFAPDAGIDPYLYAGLGAMLYKRVNGVDSYVPNSRFYTTVLVPMGIGAGIPVSNYVSLVADVGYRVTDDYVDYIKAGKLDGFVSAKIGVNFTIGGSDRTVVVEAPPYIPPPDTVVKTVVVPAPPVVIKDTVVVPAPPVVVKDTVVVERPLVLERGKTVILKGINFETGKATLTADSKEILQKAYDALVANPDVEVEIVGHTDSVGNRAYNRDLSIRRAKAVKAWMVNMGIAPLRMTTSGRGMDEPIDVNSTAEGRANNRRIEFRVKK
jgi:outer membrane protein OmpA-like peptidoglycan-associated protein